MWMNGIKYDNYIWYPVLDNQKASKNTFQATTVHSKVEENSRTFLKDLHGNLLGLFKEKWNSRTFQGFSLKFKDLSRLCEPCNKYVGHFWVAPSHCFKGKVSARSLVWKYFILVQINLIFTKWKFLEFGYGLHVVQRQCGKKIQIGIGQCTVADIQLTQLHCTFNTLVSNHLENLYRVCSSIWK